MRLTLVYICLVVMAVLLSAFIHMADPDVGGVTGLASPMVIFSVLFYAMVPLAIMIGISEVRRTRGLPLSVVSCLLAATLLATFLHILITPYPGLSAILERIVKTALFLTVVLASGSLLPLGLLRVPTDSRV